jgi:hypothetical protein
MGPEGEGVREGGWSGCEWYGIAAMKMWLMLLLGLGSAEERSSDVSTNNTVGSFRVSDSAERKGADRYLINR